MIESYGNVNVHKITHVEHMAAIIVILLPFNMHSTNALKGI